MGWCSWRTVRCRWAAPKAPPRWKAVGRPAVLWPALLAAAAGCGGGPRPDAGPAPGSGRPVEPGDIVAEFLDAANSRDHVAMARLFGTERGPIGEVGSAFGCGLRRAGSWIGLGEPCVTAQEIELRMDVIARILAHRSRRVGSPAVVAGRGRPAARVEVEMAVRGGEVVRVPFVLIQAERHGWLVEQVELGRLTG